MRRGTLDGLAALGLALALAAGCRAGSPPPEDTSRPRTGEAHCAPVSGRLPAGPTLAGRGGSYQLTLVLVVEGVEVRSETGALTLRRQPPGLDSLGKASTPLFGFTDIDLRKVGAQRVGDPAAEDPHAPGVLVLESGHAGERSILLRLGADANRRDTALFDGAWTVLEVREIGPGGFAGGWRSGVRLARAEGYFCAEGVP